MNLSALLFLSLYAVGASSTSGTWANSAVAEELYNSIVVGDYSSAVARTVALHNTNNGFVIADIVNRLLINGKRNTVEFAYRLWNCAGADIVKIYFPIQFRIIVNGNYVKLVNRRDNLAVKLGWSTDSAHDRQAYGAKDDKTSDRVSWMLAPIWEDNTLFFKIVNVKHNQHLKLEFATDGDGEHKAWGCDESDTHRHQWYLHPVKVENDVLFYIHNRQYNHALKLGRAVDSDGDRVVWGHNGNVYNSPGLFGWVIMPF